MTHPLGEWAEAIERLAPLNERVSGLLCRFHPESGRHLVFQVLPAHATPLLVLDPKTRLIKRGEFWAPDSRYPLALERAMVDQVAWAIYQETGRYARSYWVVQGDKGGHKRRFTPQEAKLAELHGFPPFPPNPGDLPYAPVDRRVVDQLALYDQVQFWNYALDLADRRPEHFDEDERRGVVEVQSRLWDWLEHQIDRSIDDLTTYKRKLQIDATADAPSHDYEALKHAITHAEV